MRMKLTLLKVMEEMIKSDRGRMLSDITVLLFTCKVSFNAVATFYNFTPWVTQLLTAFAVFFGVIIAIASVRWIYGILPRLRSTDKLSNNLCSDNEYCCIVQVVAYNLLLWGIIVVKSVTDSWQLGSINESGVIAFTFLQIFFIVIITGNLIHSIRTRSTQIHSS